MQWHYLQNEQTLGPINEEDLRELIRTGAVAPDVLVWKEGMADWQPYSQVSSDTIPPTPASTGLRIAASTPATHTVESPPVASPAQEHHAASGIAPLGLRITAKLIDFAALAICIAVLVIVVQWIWSVAKQSAGQDKQAIKSAVRIGAVIIGFLLAIFYRKVAANASFGAGGRQSPGKRLMKLHVVDAQGRAIGTSTKIARFAVQVLMVGGLFFITLLPLTMMTHMSRLHRRPPPPPSYQHGPPPPSAFRGADRGVGRFFMVFVISLAVSQAGYVVALFNPQRRGLHDLLCGTRVIHSP